MDKTVVHVRVDEDLKEQADALFESMGMSMSEAIRIFLKQCILDQKLPFQVKSYANKGENAAYGFLKLYSKPITREQEREGWIRSLAKK